MRKMLFSLIMFLVCLNLFSQKIYLNENGIEINKEKFLENWRNEELNLYRWDYIKKDSGRVAKLNTNRFNYFKVNYDTIIKQLNVLSKKIIPNDAIIIIEYEFSNDLCSAENENKWTKNRLKTRHDFLAFVEKKIHDENAKNYYFKLFDKDLVISDYIDSIDNYIIDKNDFFKTNFFNNPALCGSHVLIKPDGFAMVKNGEDRTDFLLKYLEQKVWDEIFKLE